MSDTEVAVRNKPNMTERPQVRVTCLRKVLGAMLTRARKQLCSFQCAPLVPGGTTFPQMPDGGWSAAHSVHRLWLRSGEGGKERQSG